MNFLIVRFFISLIFATSLVQAEIVQLEFESGVMQGRQDSVYGTYNSVFPKSFRSQQSQILDLEKIVYGLKIENIDNIANVSEETVKKAGQLYLLEFYCFSLMNEIASASKSSVYQGILLNQLNHIYKHIRILSEKNFENMVRFIDLVFPGPNGIQNKKLTSKYGMIYEPNYRSDFKLTKNETDILYQKRLSAFLSQGGQFTDIHILTSDFYNSLSGLNRFEYVEMLNGEVRVTTGEAGHLILAEGKPVKSAGQIVILKNTLGQTVHLGISNASGNYKPDLFNIEQLATRLSIEFSINRNLIVTTKGEPIGLQTVKIFLKGLKKSKNVIANQIKEYERKADSLWKNSKNARFKIVNRCEKIFD